MSMKADRNGFLMGEPMGDGDSERILSAIKGDTGRILAAMRQLRGSGGARSYSAGGARASLMHASSGPVASPAGRGGGAFTGRVRGADGRFIASSASSGGSTAAQASRRVAEVADAAQAMARTAETQRRDAKADKATSQNRGSDGRFGEGARGGRLGGIASALGSSGGAALNGSEQIDPLLGAVGEIRGIASAARGVIGPIGRAGAGLFGMARGGGGGDQPTGWLRKMWRELRGMRKDEAKANRDTLRGINGIKGGSSGEGGGLLSGLFSLLPSFSSLVPILVTVGGGLASFGAMLEGLKRFLPNALTGVGDAAKGAIGPLMKRLPFVGALFEAVTGVFEDQRIAGDDTLSDAEKRRARGENAGASGGALAGAAGGAALGSLAFPVVGTVIGAVVGGLAGSSAGRKLGGWVSGMFESGRGGAGTVSTGKGDFGGKSYGTHQLSSNTGTLQKFLSGSGHGSQFAGLAPGSAEFDAKWKSLAASDPLFGGAQHDFISSTHVGPMMARLKKSGIDLTGRGEAVKESVFSTATQFGPGSNLIRNALAGQDAAGMSDAAIVAAIQDYKIANNSTLFKSSSAAVQASTLNRAGAEKSALLALAGGVASPGMPGLASVSAPSALMAPGAAPQLDPGAGTRVNSSAAPGPAAPAAPLAGQDVRDRTIAHIVTGGIGAGLTHR